MTLAAAPSEVWTLMTDAWDGNVARLEDFFDKYPDALEITRGEPIGWTALMWSAQGGNAASIEFLLGRGANIEARDLHGQTPLIMAANKGNAGAVKLLLEKGADVMATDKEGKSAADHARAEGRTDALALLGDAIAARQKIREEAERAWSAALLRAETALQDKMRATARSGKFRIGKAKP